MIVRCVHQEAKFEFYAALYQRSKEPRRHDDADGNSTVVAQQNQLANRSITQLRQSIRPVTECESYTTSLRMLMLLLLLLLLLAATGDDATTRIIRRDSAASSVGPSGRPSLFHYRPDDGRTTPRFRRRIRPPALPGSRSASIRLTCANIVVEMTSRDKQNEDKRRPTDRSAYYHDSLFVVEDRHDEYATSAKASSFSFVVLF